MTTKTNRAKVVRLKKYTDNDIIVRKYLGLLNREIIEFYRVDGKINKDYEIRGSRIHYKSSVRYLEKQVETNLERHKSSSIQFDEMILNDVKFRRRVMYGKKPFEMGTYWSGKEKRLFFQLISRFSIHRLDDWCMKLPGKSKMEILNYYLVLKKNLVFLKNMRYIGLWDRSKYPIAYEMDENYIELEDYLSNKISDILIEASAPDEFQENEDSLISIKQWEKRWNRIYRKSNVVRQLQQNDKFRPMSYYRTPLKMSNKTMKILELVVRQHVRKLLWFAVLPNIHKRSISKRELLGLEPREEGEETTDDLVISFSESEKRYPHVVTDRSIENAVTLMKKEGHHAYMLGESILDMITKFDIEYKPADGKVFKRRETNKSILPKLIEKTVSYDIIGDPTETRLDDTSMVPTLEDKYNDAEKLYARKLEKVYETRLKGTSIDPNVEFEDPFCDDQLPLFENRLDNPVEFEMIDWETNYLETRDMVQSTRHQDALFNFFFQGYEDTTISTIEDTTMDQLAALDETDCPINISKTLKKWFVRS
ncbi:hypothetical protein KAFR_0H02170 [Kazachstania africana CBS 2517]|uniref:Myb-like domain-containing protein n=1 Tax=Kazachstania africana (strain ATCC 22294 / BCRC 22015 / CBS 2517 / CECT 1963 / NBRC 1671 / NRRL Y-8276) TaxID=1071382 RepID=H2AZ70_KAZAF|nr:hypothetical protein KAFR_0H02170 [Kazachstania africana CBS 2517]CCF59626.1 hypothetical protein KAFR_0H02170 [Kazachstania africana CBS 2517]